MSKDGFAVASRAGHVMNAPTGFPDFRAAELR